MLKLNQQINAIHEAATAKLMADARRQTAFHEWCQTSRGFLQQAADGWVVPRPEVALKVQDTNPVAATNFSISTDATISFNDKAKEEVKVTLPLPDMWVSAIRLEILPHTRTDLKEQAIKAWKGTALAAFRSFALGGQGNQTAVLLRRG